MSRLTRYLRKQFRYGLPTYTSDDDLQKIHSVRAAGLVAYNQAGRRCIVPWEAIRQIVAHKLEDPYGDREKYDFGHEPVLIFHLVDGKTLAFTEFSLVWEPIILALPRFLSGILDYRVFASQLDSMPAPAEIEIYRKP